MSTYNTIEATVKGGVIYPVNPEKIPKEGKLLLIVLDESKNILDEKKIRSLLGWLNNNQDSVEWQRNVRAEWDNRL
jgi:hypothetical protein